MKEAKIILAFVVGAAVASLWWCVPLFGWKFSGPDAYGIAPVVLTMIVFAYCISYLGSNRHAHRPGRSGSARGYRHPRDRSRPPPSRRAGRSGSIRRLEAEITNLRDRMQARELFHDRKWAAERNARTDAETDLRVALGRVDELESLKS